MNHNMEHKQKRTFGISGNEGITKAIRSSTFGVFLILFILCAILSIAATSTFLTTSNLLSVFRQISFISIAAIGVTLVIITGGIDLSLGSVYGLSGVACAIAMVNWQLGVIPGILFGVAVGGLCGLINGALVTKVNFPPFIATLGMMSAARGVAYGITNGYPIYGLSKSFKTMGQDSFLGIPIPILVMLCIAVIVAFFLRKTTTGRRIYAIGGNEEASRVSGVDTVKVKLFVYIVCGMLAGFAGILTASRLGTAQPAAGLGLELNAIAAVIIGGASLSGGVGNIAGPVMGAAIMGVLNNAITLLGINAYWQNAVIGTVIILAIMFDKVRTSKSRL